MYYNFYWTTYIHSKSLCSIQRFHTNHSCFRNDNVTLHYLISALSYMYRTLYLIWLWRYFVKLLIFECINSTASVNWSSLEDILIILFFNLYLIFSFYNANIFSSTFSLFYFLLYFLKMWLIHVNVISMQSSGTTRSTFPRA